MPSSAISVTLPSENDDRAYAHAAAAGASSPLQERRDGRGGMGEDECDEYYDDDDDGRRRMRQQQQQQQKQAIRGRGPLLARSISGLRSIGTSMLSLRRGESAVRVPSPSSRSAPDDGGGAIAGAAAHSGNALENYVIPSVLRMNADASYATADHLGWGMEVIKVSKVR